MSDLLHFEDFTVGESWDLGAYDVTADEVKSFAREFDPQFFHLDEEKAKSSVLGGLSASGWHSCGMLMRMMVDGYLARTAGMAESALRAMLQRHGFSVANFSYRLDGEGRIRRHSMVLRTSDRSAASRLSETLEATDIVLEFRLSPTGD